jgi:hypothetical protein
MSSNRPTVLILASDPAFSREITANWPQEPAPRSHGPEFIVLDEGFSRELKGSHYDLAIADASSVDKIASPAENNNDQDRNSKDKNAKAELAKNNLEKNDLESADPKGKSRRQRLNKRLNRDLKRSLLAAGKPAIVIHSDPTLDFYNIHGAVIDLRREPGLWPAITGLVGREILRRAAAEAHSRQAERTSVTAEAEATLGRYMVEMRTNVNNALTTVLGNAELLVHEPGLPASVQVQADAIRNMALRLHEVFQRFSSIEKELNVAAREPAKKAAAAAAGKR